MWQWLLDMWATVHHPMVDTWALVRTPLFLFLEVCSLLVAGHALLRKSDPRTAWAWISICILVPALGPILYFVFGVDRIQRKGRKLHRRRAPFTLRKPDPDEKAEWAFFEGAEAPFPSNYLNLVRIGLSLTGRPLTVGNTVEVLQTGIKAFPLMLEAIQRAEKTVYMTTYIFEVDAVGQQFVNALAAAKERGVDVRVIVDGIGAMKVFTSAVGLLRRKGVPVERFLPPRLLPPTLGMNLRNHHKLLVVDSAVAFTGGMNLGVGYLGPKITKTLACTEDCIIDTHFRLTGPVAAQMEEVFLWDWGFVRGTEKKLPEPDPVGGPGPCLCRTVPEGPSEEMEKLEMIMAAALGAARRQVNIITPYFLPPRELVFALSLAAQRGVDVRVVLPETCDNRIVTWASRHLLPVLLRRGVRVFIRPGPFAHAKLFTVDDHYSLIGSANWDPRSLRLNFELNVEVFDAGVAGQLNRHVEEVIKSSQPLSLVQLSRLSLPVRLRNALAWLFSPYL